MKKNIVNNNLFSLNPLPSWIYDFKTLEILEVNSTAIEHYGYTREEFLGLTLRDLRPAQEVPKLINAHADINNREGNIYFGVFTHQKKSGMLMQMEINGHKVDFNDRQCMLVICQDVTEKIEQKEKILQSEQRFKALVQEGSDLIGILDAAGKYLYVSPSSISILGIVPEEFIGTSLFEFIHPDDADNVLSNLQAIATEKKVHVNPFRIRNINMKWCWVETVLTNMMDNPAVNGIVANSRDITEKVEAQKQLEANELFNRTVLESSPDCLKILDGEGHLLFMNFNGLCQMEIDDFSDFKNKKWWTLWGAENQDLVKDAVNKALKGQTVQFTAFCPTAKGTPKWWDVMVSPVGKPGEQVQQLLSVSRDVTLLKQKELEKELLGKISQHFSFENNLHSAATALCQTIHDYGQFDFVELWLPTIENTHIYLFAKEFSSPNAKTFYKCSKEIKLFAKGEDLPGVVWDKRTTQLWEVLSKKNDFVRKEAAQKAGIESAMGIPLIFNEKIAGVMVIGSQQELHHLKKYKDLFEHLKVFIGSEINRKKLENDLQYLYSAIPDIICITDLQGRFLKINHTGCELIGHSEEEILHQPFHKFIHPDDQEISHRYLEKLRKGGKSFGFENRFVTRNGEIVWLNWTSNSNLKEGLVYATARNITEEKRLRELNRQASKLAKIGGWEVDLVGNKIFWSDMVHELHETDPASFFPDLETVINFYREDYLEMVNQEVARCIKTGTAFDFEAVIITAKKQERWVRVIGNAEMADGKCKRIYGSFQDIDNLKKSEIKLKESENRLRTILDAEPECIKLLGPGSELLMMNPAGLSMIEAENEEQVLGKSVLGIIVPEYRPAFSELTKNVFEGKSGKLVFEIEGFKGMRRWLETHAVPLKNEHGDIISLLGVTRDITGQKKAEEELRNAFEAKNNILESIGDAFFAVDKNWMVTYWNKEAEKVLGIKREAIVGENLWEIYADAGDTAFYRQYHKAMETGKNVSFEEYYATLYKWLEVSAYPSREGLSVYFKDVTHRKEADIRLLQANERFEKVTEATSDVIWDWNIEKDSLYRSQNIHKFFGKSAAIELIKKDFWNDSFHPNDLQKIKESLYTVLNDPQQNRWEAEYRIYNESGNIVHIIDRGLIIRDAKGKAIRMIGAMTDITNSKIQEEQLLALNESLQAYAKELERSNEELESFAFITSHDLQEPLRMVASFMDQLERKYGDQLDEKALRYIHFASDGARRMKQIILDMLDYSRAGRTTESKEDVDLNIILSEFKQLRKKIISEKAVSISATELPIIYSYKAIITQVLHSLLDNAIKYSKEKVAPYIEIAASENDDEWKFSIKDNGIGIDSEFFDKIFIIFQRLHNRNEFEGTGIGLSIAKKQVEFLGGKIWVESTPGEGSTFYFTLPKKH
jgi:PAS domain S-box-containing protein